MALSRVIEKQAERNPEAIALLAPGRAPLRYGQLVRHCERVAAALNQVGIGRGDRVAVVLPNGPEMAACLLSVTMTAICAPLNPAYRTNEFEYFLSEPAPAALIVEQGAESAAVAVAEARGIRVIRLCVATGEPAGIFSLDCSADESSVISAIHNDGDDVALALYTSGATANPKLVSLTHANLQASVQNVIGSMALTPNDRVLNIMPLFHISGIIGVLLSTLASGGSVVCTPGFYVPRFFDWCREFAPTWYFGVPAMHRSIVARAHENPTAGWVIFVFIFQFLVGIYGGYFGGGIGILMLAALGLIGLTDLHEMNGLKNLLAICINGIAALYFAFGGAVLWRDGAIMALAAIVGGYLGARIARRLGRTFVRRAVVVIGVVMGIAMFFKR